MYQEFQPNPLLHPYIETYWASNSFAGEEVSQRILPDGCVDIIFSFGAQTLFPFIVGTMTSFFDVIYKKDVKLFGIRFRPGGITVLTRVPISEFTNMRFDIRLVETILDKHLFEEMENSLTIEDTLSCLDSYFLQKLPLLFVPDKQIGLAVNLIEQAKGNIPISLLAQQACLSPRQFERRFKVAIGISPKEFGRITKFKNLSRFMKEQPRQSLFETAVDCGYYDHAHLIREFKRLSGYTPREL